jgi:hypothetical protein
MMNTEACFLYLFDAHRCLLLVAAASAFDCSQEAVLALNTCLTPIAAAAALLLVSMLLPDAGHGHGRLHQCGAPLHRHGAVSVCVCGAHIHRHAGTLAHIHRQAYANPGTPSRGCQSTWHRRPARTRPRPARTLVPSRTRTAPTRTLRSSSGVPLSLDDFQRVSDRTPLICDLKPSGRYVMEDIHKVRFLEWD